MVAAPCGFLPELNRFPKSAAPSVELAASGTSSLGMEITMAWFLLFLAGLFECGWAIGLKYTDGFTRPLPTTLTVISMVVSVVLLGIAVKTLPIGTAYAVWTGIGSVGTVLLGIWLLGDAATASRLLCISLIVAGIAGLKATA
ncbi:Quaternary ammonium compound-resistance protein sugE [Rhizobium favelukesii]|uniref:Guanidinium exporter n=2 Tax=Rhizobium/Agrobacterium group TaxID=227290 RepID=W6RB08_9HYPH|nr:Quaternary ammonium compound-resistance protein sugE [Rhizobium favelukesii]